MIVEVREILIFTLPSSRSIQRIPSLQILVQSNNRKTRTLYEICSQLTIKTVELRN